MIKSLIVAALVTVLVAGRGIEETPVKDNAEAASADSNAGHQDAQAAFLDGNVGHQDAQVASADSNAGHHDVQAVSSDSNAGHQDAKAASAESKVGHQDAKAASAESKVGHQDAKAATAATRVSSVGKTEPHRPSPKYDDHSHDAATYGYGAHETHDDGEHYNNRAYNDNKHQRYLYKYDYQVEDDYSDTFQGKNEEADTDGVVHGQYYNRLPDGRLQTVTYTVDHYSGYVPHVEYKGEAKYPTAYDDANKGNYKGNHKGRYKGYYKGYKGYYKGYKRGYQAGHKAGHKSAKQSYRISPYWAFSITLHLVRVCN